MKKLLVAVLLLLAVGGGALYYSLGMPYAAYDKEAFVVIPPRTSTQEIADLLQNAGVVRAGWQFLAARALKDGKANAAPSKARHRRESRLSAAAGRRECRPCSRAG